MKISAWVRSIANSGVVEYVTKFVAIDGDKVYESISFEFDPTSSLLAEYLFS